MQLTPNPLKRRGMGGSLAANLALALFPGFAVAQVQSEITVNVVSAEPSAPPYAYDPFGPMTWGNDTSSNATATSTTTANVTEITASGATNDTNSTNSSGPANGSGSNEFGNGTGAVAGPVPSSAPSPSVSVGRLPSPSSDARDAPRTATNYSLPAFSPMLTFWPPTPALASEGWNLTYSSVSWSHYTNDSIANGTALQTTSLQNASVSVWFVGSAVYIKGTLNGSVTIAVQNQYHGSDSGEDEWYSREYFGDGTKDGTDNLSIIGNVNAPSRYNMTLSLNSGSFALDSIIVSAPVGGLGSVPTKASPLNVVDSMTFEISEDVNPIGVWNTSFAYCGNVWNETTQTQNDWCEDSTGLYGVISTSSQNARLSFSAPQNTSIFTVFGTMGTNGGPYRITTQDFDYDEAYATYTTQSPWLNARVPLYTGALDPRTLNTINIDFLGSDEASQLDIYQVVFVLTVGGRTDYTYITSPHDPSSRRRVGKIVGGAVGGAVGGLLVLGGLAWFFMRRSRKRKREIDPGEKHLSSPAGRRRAVGQLLPSESDSLSVFEVHGPESVTDPNPSVITPLPRPKQAKQAKPAELSHVSHHQSPATQLSTVQLLEHKMREARGAEVQRDVPSTPLSPTGAGQSVVRGAQSDPPTLPPLKLSLMTEDLMTSQGFAPLASHSPSSSAVGGGSPLIPSPLTPAASYIPASSSRPQQRTVTEEEDAGRLPALVEETIPPRYNPAWADEYTATGTVGDTAAGMLVASGPTTLAERQMRDNMVARGHPEVLTGMSRSPESPSDSTRRLVSLEGSSGGTSTYDSESPSPHSEVGPSIVRKSDI